MPEDLAITQRLVIPAADLELSYSRAGGPGGQKVNKTESRAQLSFDLEGCTALHPAVKARVRASWGSRLTKDGRLVMACDSHRERSRNVAELRDRLASIIRSCLEPPRPRRATKPSRAAKRRRLDAKKQRGRTKQLRGKVQRDD
jgi:ribosome-associated protein